MTQEFKDKLFITYDDLTDDPKDAVKFIYDKFLALYKKNNYDKPDTKRTPIPFFYEAFGAMTALLPYIDIDIVVPTPDYEEFVDDVFNFLTECNSLVRG